VIDDDHAFAQLLDILHVVAGEHRHDLVLGVIEPEEFAHLFLAGDVEADRRLIEKEHTRRVDERGDEFHLHPLAEAQLTHHRVELICAIEQLREPADDLREARPIDPVDCAIQLQRFARGQVPPQAFFWPISSANCRFISSRRSHGVKPSTLAEPEVGFSSPESIFSTVVFPAPFGPRKPTNSPSSIENVTSSAARMS
jgi:hypothetical protein